MARLARHTPVADADRAHPERYAARFYGDPQLRDAYAARVRQLATRKNTITGVRYGADATILAWELMNEPRDAPDDWIAFAAEAVRTHCAQLVGLGDEAARDSPDLDLASLHFYPEKHGGAGDEERFGCAAITQAARRATRPLVVGEFGLRHDGLPLAARQAAYAAWFAWAAEEPGVVGMGPWLLGYRARPPDWDEGFTFYAGGDYDATFRDAVALFS